MLISDIIQTLENFAPLAYQEAYDNCGLLIGNKNNDCTGVLCSLDVTTAIIEEAKQKKCNLIVAHHPIIFGGIKKIVGNNEVEQTIISAIKNDIAIYACHTNLDNVFHGVNHQIAERLGLINRKILQPKANILSKLFVFVPQSAADKVRNALFDAGAGTIANYSECSFNTLGEGTFMGNENSNPSIGEQHIRESVKEVKIEVIFPSYLQNSIVEHMKLAHPYEEVAYDIIPLSNQNQQVGSGMMGELETETDETSFLKLLAHQFCLKSIKHTKLLNKPIKKVAFCGGAGSFLIKNAIAAKADIYISSDIKYHEFFDAEGKIVVVDMGHWESEQFTIELLIEIIRAKTPTFAVLKSEVNTNPVSYFTV